MTEFDFAQLLEAQEQTNTILIALLVFVAANLGAQLIRNLRR